MSYFGTEYSPSEYYRICHAHYINEQSSAIKQILNQFEIKGRVIDLGCGDGLVTKLLSNIDFVGIDSSPEMISRYNNETKSKGIVGNFWDVLPKADMAIASHCLHLCPISRMHEVRYRLQEAGVSKVIVTSPFKTTGELLKMNVRAKISSKTNEDKTVWGWELEF